MFVVLAYVAGTRIDSFREDVQWPLRFSVVRDALIRKYIYWLKLRPYQPQVSHLTQEQSLYFGDCLIVGAVWKFSTRWYFLRRCLLLPRKKSALLC